MHDRTFLQKHGNIRKKKEGSEYHALKKAHTGCASIKSNQTVRYILEGITLKRGTQKIEKRVCSDISEKYVLLHWGGANSSNFLKNIRN